MGDDAFSVLIPRIELIVKSEGVDSFNREFSGVNLSHGERKGFIDRCAVIGMAANGNYNGISEYVTDICKRLKG